MTSVMILNQLKHDKKVNFLLSDKIGGVLEETGIMKWLTD